MEIDQTPIRIICHFVDDLRVLFNRQLDHLEPWQIVLYTLSVILFVQWVKKIFKNEEIFSLQKWWNEMLLNIPIYHKRLEETKEAVHKEIEERLLRFDRLKEFYKFLPDRGLETENILNEAYSYKAMNDAFFGKNSFCGSVFVFESEDPELQKLLKNIFELFSYSNASYPEVFPSCRKMEAEIIRILCSLYHGSTKSCGALTNSGMESILLACLAYRNRALKHGIRKPEMIVGRNAHVGFSEAAKLFGMHIVWVGLNKNYEVNVGAIKRAIGRETCMIVASAPSFITGIMDNIEKIAQLGLRYHVPVHVDASIGGFILPFMEQCDYFAPTFDFRLSSVSSISVDLHKYAYCPTGSSAILYRDSQLLHYQCLSNVNWSGGIYVSQTLADSRSGLLIALTWATLLYNGRLGFVEKTHRILDCGQMICKKLEENENIEVLGSPLGPVLSFAVTNPGISTHVLGVELNELGWTVGFLQDPIALRLSISLHQTRNDTVERFIEDINNICNKLLGRVVSPTIETDIPTKICKTNVIHGISTVFKDRSVAEFLPRAVIDAYYATPNLPFRTTRTLSIEGRKISQIHMPPGLASIRQRYANENNNTLVVPSSNLLEPPQE